MNFTDEEDEEFVKPLTSPIINSVGDSEDEANPNGKETGSAYLALRSADTEVTFREPWTKRLRASCMEPGALLCISHLFSYWGDRMWSFAVGLYLVEMTPNSLRLTAIYGFVRTLSMVIFGPAVGDWVDITPRLRAVKLSLVTQNILVTLCAVLVLLHLLIHRPHEHKAVYITLEVGIIVFGAMAFLVGRSTTIAVERDWVVVIANGDKERLTGLNTKLRRIDLTCAILGPAAVGFIMSLVSKYAGIVLICSWNILSFFLEYYLLLHVYKSVPTLATKEHKVRSGSTDSMGDAAATSRAETESETGTDMAVKHSLPVTSLNLWRRTRSFLKGWSVYYRQSVALAGVSLAMLYLTFLGFSSITTAYLYTQRLSEGIISVCYAAASLVGILGTIIFPPLRRKVGLPRTGLFSFFLQLLMLALCVVSIWLPGSPFFFKESKMASKNLIVPIVSSCSQEVKRTFTLPLSSALSSTFNASSVMPTPQLGLRTTSLAFAAVRNHTSLLGSRSPTTKDIRIPTVTTGVTPSSEQRTSFLPTASLHTPLCKDRNHEAGNNTTRGQKQKIFSYWSVSVLVTGLILSRAGLWMTDLTVTQLMQENVIETERGIVSGTQQAFNSILDLVHYILTIGLSRPGQFWMLILVSYAAIFMGYLIYILFYMRFTRKLAQERPDSAVFGSHEQLISE